MNRLEEKQATGFGRFRAGDMHPMLMIREIWRKFWAVILSAIIFACCGYVIREMTYRPIYRTSTTLVVMQGGATSVYGNRSAANTLATNLSKLLNGEMLRRTIAQELGVQQFNGKISAEPLPETNLVVVTAESNSPRMAFSILRTAMEHYDDLGNRSLGNIDVYVLYPAAAPSRPINNPGGIRTAKRAALAGAVFMMLAIAAATYLRDTVKSEKEVEEKLDARLLTVVQHEQKNKTLRDMLRREKKSLLITSPTTGFLYVETIKKLRARVEYQMKRSNAKVVMVTSVSENEGKSTIAANLALAMSRKYEHVLLVDGDMKKPALYKILGYQEEEFSTLPELLRGNVKLSDALLVDTKRKISTLLCRNGIEDSSELLKSERMEQLIRSARAQMDIVIIDTPPMAVSPDAECIADVADAAILVVRQDRAQVRVINDSIDMLSLSKAELLGCVLNNYYTTEFADHLGYGYGGRYGYGMKYGYGRYGYGKKAGYGAKLGYGSRVGYGSKLGYGSGSGEEADA